MHPNIISLVIFMFVLSFAPGPNNYLASYSAFNFGIKKTFPLMLGVIIGFTTMVAVFNFGLIATFNQFPIIQNIIKIIGSFFLLYLAYKIAFSSSKQSIVKNPVSFIHTFFFQFINPKGLLAAIVAISTFVEGGDYFLRDTLWVIFVSFFFAVFSICFWTLLGKFLRKFATNEKFIKLFNYVMSILLLISIATFYI